MKLRIRGNSVRLRLTQIEVETLRTRNRVEELTQFSPETLHSLKYSIESSDLKDIRAYFVDNEIRVRVPEPIIQEWANTDRVGIEVQQSIGHGETLRILIEKDFACLKPREDEDDSFAYPNPLAQ